MMPTMCLANNRCLTQRIHGTNGIFTYMNTIKNQLNVLGSLVIYHKNQLNVGKHSINGGFGYPPPHMVNVGIG